MTLIKNEVPVRRRLSEDEIEKLMQPIYDRNMKEDIEYLLEYKKQQQLKKQADNK